MARTRDEDEPRYVKGDRVWVLRGRGVREPGVVIGYYVDWDLYRVVYTVDLAEGPRALEEWRPSFREKGEERGLWTLREAPLYQCRSSLRATSFRPMR